jgi:carboxypeptidase C (cathepsin A)
MKFKLLIFIISIFTIVISFIFFYFLFFGVWSNYWQETSATVIQSEVKSISGGKNTVSVDHIFFKYSYKIKDKNYVNNRIAYGIHDSDKDVIQEFSKIKANQKIKVYVNPFFPDSSTVRQGVFNFTDGIGGVMACLIFLLLALKYGKKILS